VWTVPELFSPIAHEIWEQKYRLVSASAPMDRTIDDTLMRVAKASAGAEPADRDLWRDRFYSAMQDLAFLPGGRILAGAGSGRKVTLFNCFVLGRIEDDLSSIFDAVREAALTMQAGGGIGHDFSSLRPRGARVGSIDAEASGPTSFMDVWDAMCRAIMSAGHRRGAMMATLRCDHPDIVSFITAKSTPGRLRNFNLSVLVSDAFIAAVEADGPWDLVFGGTVYETVRARDLWGQITQSNYAFAEPGVIFIDRVNALNNLAYCEQIYSTNPCGEQPLPPYGACLLGSVNLTRLIVAPFSRFAHLDRERLEDIVTNGVRLLDNIIDISRYPLPQQEVEAKTKRRIGLGITGLADALIMLGLDYGSPEGRTWAANTMATIKHLAYRASAALAEEKGAFPIFDRDAFLARPSVSTLPQSCREMISRNGIRNACLTSIAPTGTISLLAGNVSSGIEPVFAMSYRRRFQGAVAEQDREEVVEDYAHAVYRQVHGRSPAIGAPWVTAASLQPVDHLLMQAALQPHVDSAISKTINCPSDIALAAFDDLYLQAYRLGLKGCTTFRPNAVTGSILSLHEDEGTVVSSIDGRSAMDCGGGACL
jgi:ribonucleoside-diphosphate reductase alpha chain